MVEAWPNIKNIMEFWKSLSNYKQPTCKSYSEISFICSIVNHTWRSISVKNQWSHSCMWTWSQSSQIFCNWCQTRSVRKMQNCQTASWNQLGWKWTSGPHKQSRTGIWCPWFIKLKVRHYYHWWNKKIQEEAQCFIVSTLKKIFDKSPFTCEFVR